MTQIAQADQGCEIRPAEVRDVREIAEFHVEVWRESYRGMMDAEFLGGLSPDRREVEWTEALERSPGYRVLVAHTHDGGFLGFASAQTHDEASDCLALELHTLNVKPEARGMGLARRLLDGLLAESPAFLWVVEGNDRAIEFYRKAGFTLTDERRPDPESQVDDLRMVRGTVT